MNKNGLMNTIISAEGSLEILSHSEVKRLRDTSHGGLHDLLRRCCLAVLNTGSPLDDGRLLMERHQDFGVSIISEARGLSLDLRNAPASAFVDGKLIKGIQEHLFAVVRDILYATDFMPHFMSSEEDAVAFTHTVFYILRNAGLLKPQEGVRTVVCWGGHAINRQEYDYSKRVGYELGLRGLNICTGCGTGAMKGPMKGATIAHAKQRIKHGRYIGISEWGIIAAEPPNPIVSDLVIMPDMEKRLEAFIRFSHGVVVFPGGAGTTEEVLYILGVLMHPENASISFPLILTGPDESRDYLQTLHAFIGETLGANAQQRYHLIIDDPAEVARAMMRGLEAVHQYRTQSNDAYYFNWLLRTPAVFQQPFIPTHQNMSQLSLHDAQAPHLLAANLRRAFSGIVAGNVKPDGIMEVEKHGPFLLKGDEHIITPVDSWLRKLVAQHRMKIAGGEYEPCYRLEWTKTA